MEKIIDISEIRALNNMQIKAKVNGYTLSKTLRGKNGNFKEIIPIKTWQNAIAKIGDKFNVFYNHQPLIDVAKDRELKAEADGVYLYATLRDGAENLYSAIKEKKVKGMSFGFKVLKDTWENIGNFKQRTVQEMELMEVSILDVIPAYSDTSIAIRAIQIPLTYADILKIRQRQLDLLKL